MKKKTVKARAWKAFLPITPSLKVDEPPDADARWLASRGIDVEALSVLRCLRRQVLPVVKAIDEKYGLISYHFLIHGCAEGVPCPVEDSRAFVDLSLFFYETAPADPRKLLRDWCWVAPRKVPEGSLDEMISLHEQSKFYLGVLDRYDVLDDLDLLKRVRQQLHYFANMSQMVVQ